MIVQFPSRMYGNTPGTTPCIKCGADTFIGELCFYCKYIDGTKLNGEAEPKVKKPRKEGKV